MALAKRALAKSSRFNLGWRMGTLVVLSMVFHGGLLLLPIPQSWLKSPEPEPDEIVTETEAISVTTLPTIVPPPPVEDPEPTVEPLPAAPPAPTIAPSITQVLDEILEEEFEELTPEPLEEELEDDLPDQTPPLEPDSQPEQTMPDEPEAGVVSIFAVDFPHIAEAAQGCHGYQNCYTASGDYRQASNTIRESLVAQGYTIEDHDPTAFDLNNHRIYRLQHPDQEGVRYLNIFFDGNNQYQYMITEREIDLDELKKLAAEGDVSG